MPALLFWLLVIAAIVFFQLTTSAERRSMLGNFWMVIIGLGVMGFIYQLLTQGTLSS